MVAGKLENLDPYVTHLIIATILLGGSKEPVKAVDISEYLNVSRATVSRWIARAEELGFLKSTISKKVQYVIVTQKAIQLIRSVYESIESRRWKEEVVLGEVFSGMGEGAYYMSRPGYTIEFKKVLGYVPYPGTLNLRIKEAKDYALVREWRTRVRPKIIHGFVEGGRTFGNVEVLPVRLNGKIRAYAIFPERRHYGDEVLEIIHEESLRVKLGVRDGDIVAVYLSDWD